MDKDFECASPKPFAFLQIHGSADKTIKNGGGVMNNNSYTSALETIQRIAAVNSCPKSAVTQALFYKKDFEPQIPGRETTVETLSGCKAPVAFWNIAGGAHSPKLPANYAQQILNFLIQSKL